MKVGLIDTSVIIEMGTLQPLLPSSLSVSIMTFAELEAGVQVAPTSHREARMLRLEIVKTRFDPLPFGVAEAVEYGRIVRQIRRYGRKERNRRFDLLIAATAVTNDLPLYTLNGQDLKGLGSLLEIIDPST